jgi:uncharacterized protein YndB with AHSA1/START domain
MVLLANVGKKVCIFAVLNMKTANNFPPLHLENVYTVSATTLFDAWIMIPVAELWLFQSGKNEVDLIADTKEGGEFHTIEKGRNQEISHRGKYIKIDRPNRLVFSLAVPSHFEGTSEVSVEIKQEQFGSHLLFTQKNVDTSNNVESWRSMFAQIDELLKAPYAVKDTSDKKEIITAINVVAMQMAGFVMSMTEGEMNTVPYTNSWTAAQLLTHIVKSTRGMAAALRKDANPANREITKRIIELKQTFLDITHTMQSPDGIVPEQKNYSKDAVIKELQDRLKQLKEAASTADMSGLVEGLPFGPITKLEILHFVLYHMQRHLHQMKKIADALKRHSSK